jgi:predicted transcriptional regulator
VAIIFVAFYYCHKKNCHKLLYSLYKQVHMITEIRKLTGLSHQKLGSWLGVSRTMVQFAENNERSLTGDAAKKLTMLALPLQQLKEAAHRPATPLPCSKPADFAAMHKKKMDAMKKINSKLYSRTAADKKVAGQVEGLNDDILKRLAERIEQLQDKLELHLAYAEVHRQKWEGYKEMGK